MPSRPQNGAATSKELCETPGVRSSELLMTDYQRGNNAALAQLIEQHEGPLWNYLRRMTRDESSAEDLLQETFMRVVKNAASWKPDAKFSTWLYTIARNLCIDHARRATHRKAISLDGQAQKRDSDPDRRLHDAVPGSDLNSERLAMSQQLKTRIEAALATLPEAQREVFLMREVAALPFAEIAQAVGASEATVKSRMRYALEGLRSALAGLHEGTQAATSEVRP